MTATYWVPVTAELWAEHGQWPQLQNARFTGQTARGPAGGLLAQLEDDRADPALNDRVLDIQLTRTGDHTAITGRTDLDKKDLTW
jgi:hypothetical protein